MTQAAVNNAIVLYRLAVERRDVEEAQRVYFVTEKLAQTLANPLIPLTKKYDIIEKVYGFESEPMKSLRHITDTGMRKTIS